MKKIIIYLVIASLLHVSCHEGEEKGYDTEWPVTLKCVAKNDHTQILDEWGGKCHNGETVNLAWFKTLEENNAEIIFPDIEGYYFESLLPVSVRADGPLDIQALYVKENEKEEPGKYDITIQYRDADNTQGEILKNDTVFSGVRAGVSVDYDYLNANEYLTKFDFRYLDRLVPEDIIVGKDSPKTIMLIYNKTVFTVQHLNKYDNTELYDTEVYKGVVNLGETVYYISYLKNPDDYVVDYQKSVNATITKEPEANVVKVIYQNAKTDMTVYYKRYQDRNLPYDQQVDIAPPETIKGVKVNSYINAGDYRKYVPPYMYYRTYAPFSFTPVDDPEKNHLYIYMGETKSGTT